MLELEIRKIVNVIFKFFVVKFLKCADIQEYCLPKLRKTKPELGSEKKSSFQMKARSTASTILEKSRSSTPTVSQKTSSGHPTVEKKPSSCPSTECVKTKSGFSAIQEKPRSVPARVRRNIVM